MVDKRTEFAKLRKQWMKSHGWKGFVCARCGHYSKSVHLHHIQELIYGGENTPENLIPLCSECHRELDYYSKDFPLEQFLVTLPCIVTPLVHERAMIEGAEMYSTRTWLGLCATVYRGMNLARATDKISDTDLDASDLMIEQNEFFSKYPYSDEEWRLEQYKLVYGDPVAREVQV